MRILMVAPEPFFRPRGTPISILHRIRALLQLGHEVHLVTYPFGDSPRLPGLTLHRSPRAPGVRDVAIGPSVAKLLLDVRLARAVWRIARDGDFDIIHTHEEAGVIGGWVSRALGIPHLYDMHSSLPDQFANFGRFQWPPVVSLFRAAERFSLARSEAVITVYPELRRQVMSTGYRGAVALLENCLSLDGRDPDPGEVARVRETLGLDGARAIVYTGNLERYQGAELLVHAAPLVAERWPAARFLIVGGGSRGGERLRQLAADHGLKDRFVFVPTVPPTAVGLYQRLADVLVTPRVRGENTPLKIYEYLRADQPIVATRIKSHTQVLDERCAELVEPTGQGLATGILRVLADPGRAEELRRGARELVRERYTEARYLETLSALLAQIPRSGKPLARTL